MQKYLVHDKILETDLLLKLYLNSSFVFIEVIEVKGDRQLLGTPARVGYSLHHCLEV
jgi:hypothetical protein